MRLSLKQICCQLMLAFGVLAGNSSGADAETNRTLADRLRPIHETKRKPGPRDWLAQHKEPGQTFEQYVRSKPNRPTAQRTTIYIQPVGQFNEVQRKLVTETAEFMDAFYGVPCKTLAALGLDVIPDSGRRVHPKWGDRQILSTYVLDKVLKPRRPANAVAVLALTTSDLWPGEGWNFVFGQASLQERVGVWSLYRYGNPSGNEEERKMFRRRMFKVAVHETGHMLGIPHCIAYECCINGSNNLPEMDGRPMWFCPECVAKIWWGCGVDPVQRFDALTRIAERHGLEKEAVFWRRSAALISP